MKIAVASDGAGISRHFGRCACFLVFEIAEGRIVNQETRANAFTAFALGQCNHGHEHDHGHGPLIDALRDCDAVLSYGMGWRAAKELEQNAIDVAIVAEEMTPEEATRRYLAGELQTGEGFCQCHD